MQISEEQAIAFGPLLALIDSLARKRAIFWTGNTLVEFDGDFIPTGPVTMVLDAGDVEMLLALKQLVEDRMEKMPPPDALPRLTTLDKLGGLLSDEAEALAKMNLDEATEFRSLASEDPEGPWVGFADWKKRRARLFTQLAAEESEAQAKYERKRSEQEQA